MSPLCFLCSLLLSVFPPFTSPSPTILFQVRHSMTLLNFNFFGSQTNVCTCSTICWGNLVWWGAFDRVSTGNHATRKEDGTTFWRKEFLILPVLELLMSGFPPPSHSAAPQGYFFILLFIKHTPMQALLVLYPFGFRVFEKTPLRSLVIDYVMIYIGLPFPLLFWPSFY